MGKKLKKAANYLHRLLWQTVVLWAMDRWYRSKRRANRQYKKLDRLLWRFDELFGWE